MSPRRYLVYKNGFYKFLAILSMLPYAFFLFTGYIAGKYASLCNKTTYRMDNWMRYGARKVEERS